MKRIVLLLSSALATSAVFSQSGDTQISSSVSPNIKTNQKQTEILNNRNKTEDKLEILDITGLGGATFGTMNLELTGRSTVSNIKITQSLLAGPNKTPGFQLVFTTDVDRTAYAVETQNGVTSVFFPMNTYEFIQQKLENAIAQKKKVQLKVTQNPNGFREGLLIF